MIVPTRFGLKYTPIPTLALEYEDDLKGVIDATGESSTSLYVYRDGNDMSPGPTRKLHIVELPMLTKTSETEQITRQLQQDNGRFLAPGIVSESQLKRLLDKLVENLPDPPATGSAEVREPSMTTAREAGRRQEEASESELEESVMEESVMEESVAEASSSDEHETQPPRVLSTTSEVNPNRGAFISQAAESDRDDDSEDEKDASASLSINKPANQEEFAESDHEEDHRDDSPADASTAEKDEESDREEDEKKTKALRSESDVSEEEVQSEELEYFSEDGSDEDSF
ncbi:unnamed protein product [Phytophthora lilii]|uniref:Unnamed protein product n=1 Tax=Phytophthora lilii TaxID=2077276 RepID=A0A9W6WUT1_9STRA|nr:unnamed protein product [Phytophthora lilii]